MGSILECLPPIVLRVAGGTSRGKKIWQRDRVKKETKKKKIVYLYFYFVFRRSVGNVPSFRFGARTYAPQHTRFGYGSTAASAIPDGDAWRGGYAYPDGGGRPIKILTFTPLSLIDKRKDDGNRHRR